MQDIYGSNHNQKIYQVRRNQARKKKRQGTTSLTSLARQRIDVRQLRKLRRCSADSRRAQRRLTVSSAAFSAFAEGPEKPFPDSGRCTRANGSEQRLPTKNNTGNLRKLEKFLLCVTPSSFALVRRGFASARVGFRRFRFRLTHHAAEGAG